MAQSRLIELSYFDPHTSIRLTTYADTIVTDYSSPNRIISAVRFGGYPEVVKAMSDAIYGGATIDVCSNGETLHLDTVPKGYRRQLSHDGIYAAATLMANDDPQSLDQLKEDAAGDDSTEENKPRKCYIFCPAGDQDRLFEEVDRKTAAPLIPEFRDYVLRELIRRGELRRMEVFSVKEKMDAWVFSLLPEDKNVVQVLEDGLKTGQIAIPGATPGAPDGFAQVENVTSYLSTYGITVADRIRKQFIPLFDPASEPLSDEVLAINRYIQQKAGYSLYDAQLAVAEATKRQLQRCGTALIVAECGSGKTKIGTDALGALYGLGAAQGGKKTFNLVMAPSHVTKKWVREIGETLPNTFAMVVKSITDLNRLYDMYQNCPQSVFAVFSKERARDGYMRYPAVQWNRRKKAFLCPDCMEPVEMEISEDGTRYTVNADQFFFQKEHKRNHKCRRCGAVLWAPVVPGRQIDWIKIPEYGWIYRYRAGKHLMRTQNEAVLDQLTQIAAFPEQSYPVRGAKRRFPLSTYIKRKMRGQIDAILCDELHQYNNASGQGDAMAELFGVCRYYIGMTATLINGYSSGIFHLLYRLLPGLMLKDGKRYRKPGDFDAEYGVVENTYEIKDAAYNSNRRAIKRKTKSRQLPGVSPLVYSRFLLEYTSFLSLSDMGKDLPDYEEIPVPLDMPEAVYSSYEKIEHELRMVLKTDRKAAQKILSAYLNLLTVYPDQPYDQPAIIHPIEGTVIAEPPNMASFEDILPKEEKTLEIVREKLAAGERVLIYTSWTRTDSQKKLLKQLHQEGICAEILKPSVPTEKREEWVEKRVRFGLQVLITNPSVVETGLDLNAFTTLIFYSIGYNLFTLRQASRRSWRINQTAPRVEVYLLYYANTIQAKAVKLMASKLAVAGIIEGTFSEEGLSAMSDVRDLTSQMAKELSLGIKDNVEDIAAAFKKMAVINPGRENRQKQPVQTAAGSEVFSMPAVEHPAASGTPGGIRAVESQQQRMLYEGLLKKRMEEQEKRRKKQRTVDENQLSLFGPAA